MDALEEDSSYKISNVTIRSYNGAKYVSLGERAVVKAIGNTGEIVDDCVFEGTGGLEFVEGEIIGVLKMDS